MHNDNNTYTLELSGNQLNSIVFAVGEYRSRWFDIYLKEPNAVNQMVYEHVCKLQEVLKIDDTQESN